MNISGLVVTLSSEHQVTNAIQQIRNAGPFTIGEAAGLRVAIALETDSPGISESWYRWLEQLEGVLKVDVAFVSCEASEDEK
jgi:nitrate reductase NapAB chaperone NapD